MDRKTFGIGVLSVTGLILFLASLSAPPAKGDFAVKDLQGWQLITAATQQGGDVLYVIDPDGKVLVLGYDLAQKVLKPVGGGDLGTLLAPGK